MDLNPNALVRLVQLGLRQEALSCSTIWICVGCHTCSNICPMTIDLVAMIDVLRHLALEEEVEPAEPAIAEFHRQVLGSIQRHGRAHKLEIMLRHKFESGQWFSDLDLGLRMLAKRKLDLRPSRVENLAEVRRLFARPWQR
jgi:heterodisulfide reductase subunit C